MSATLPKRSELPKEQIWSIESVFAGEAEWREAFKQVEARLGSLAPFAGRLGESAKVLLEALETRDALLHDMQRVFFYANLNQATDGANPLYQTMSAEARGLFSRVSAAAAYIQPEILAIEPARLDAFLQEEKGLEVYRHHLERLALRRPYVRSAEVESLMASVSDPLASLAAAASAATNADMKFAPVKKADQELPVSHSTINGLLVDPDPGVRKAAWESYADGHLAFKNTLTAALQGSMKSYIFQSKARGYPSALEMSLSQNFIPRSVFDNLINTFQAHLPLWHRYWSLRRKAQSKKTGRQEAVYTHDIPVYGAPAPFVKSPELTFQQAAELICRGMEPLGSEYVEPMRKGLLEERWVDWGINQGKRPGAFSSGIKGSRPFIFMSFKPDLFSMSTLAHELGHSMHSYFSRNAQPFVYASYSLFVAEVASNFNQALTRARLLREAKDQAYRMAVIEEALSNFHRYLFVMPTLARFELECYQKLEQGGALSAPYLINRLAELFAEGYGGQVEIDHERLGASWMMFLHLYQPFYVYQYATGIAAANALAVDVLQEGQSAAKRYLEFLKSGDSVFPLDALKMAGIDMTSPEPVKRAFGVLERLLDDLEAILA